MNKREAQALPYYLTYGEGLVFMNGKKSHFKNLYFFSFASYRKAVSIWFLGPFPLYSSCVQLWEKSLSASRNFFLSKKAGVYFVSCFYMEGAFRIMGRNTNFCGETSFVFYGAILGRGFFTILLWITRRYLLLVAGINGKCVW